MQRHGFGSNQNDVPSEVKGGAAGHAERRNSPICDGPAQCCEVHKSGLASWSGVTGTSPGGMVCAARLHHVRPNDLACLFGEFKIFYRVF